MADQLQAYLDGEPLSGIASGRCSSQEQKQPVFVFSGAGSLWVNMGRRLRKEDDTFARVLALCDQAVGGHMGWSVIDEIGKEFSQAQLEAAS